MVGPVLVLKAVAVLAQVANVGAAVQGVREAVPHVRTGIKKMGRSCKYHHGVFKRDCRRLVAKGRGRPRPAKDIAADFTRKRRQILAALRDLTDIADINAEARDQQELHEAVAKFCREQGLRKSEYALRKTAMESNQAGTFEDMRMYANEYKAVSGDTLDLPADIEDMFDEVGHQYHDNMTSQELQFGEGTLLLTTQKRRREGSDDHTPAKKRKVTKRTRS